MQYIFFEVLDAGIQIAASPGNGELLVYCKPILEMKVKPIVKC